MIKVYYTIERGIQALQEKSLSLEVTNAIIRMFFEGKTPPFTCNGDPAPYLKTQLSPYLTGTKRAHGR